MISSPVVASPEGSGGQQSLTGRVLVNDGWCPNSPGVIHPDKTSLNYPSHHHLPHHLPPDDVHLARVVNVSG